MLYRKWRSNFIVFEWNRYIIPHQTTFWWPPLWSCSIPYSLDLCADPKVSKLKLRMVTSKASQSEKMLRFVRTDAILQPKIVRWKKHLLFKSSKSFLTLSLAIYIVRSPASFLTFASKIAFFFTSTSNIASFIAYKIVSIWLPSKF